MVTAWRQGTGNAGTVRESAYKQDTCSTWACSWDRRFLKALPNGLHLPEIWLHFQLCSLITSFNFFDTTTFVRLFLSLFSCNLIGVNLFSCNSTPSIFFLFTIKWNCDSSYLSPRERSFVVTFRFVKYLLRLFASLPRYCANLFVAWYPAIRWYVESPSVITEFVADCLELYTGNAYHIARTHTHTHTHTSTNTKIVDRTLSILWSATTAVGCNGSVDLATHA
jgi:hypothetical protein